MGVHFWRWNMFSHGADGRRVTGERTGLKTASVWPLLILCHSLVVGMFILIFQMKKPRHREAGHPPQGCTVFQRWDRIRVHICMVVLLTSVSCMLYRAACQGDLCFSRTSISG